MDFPFKIARRGGRAGRGEVAKRFNCLSTEDWGKLIDLWEEDVKLVEEKNARRSAAQRQPLTEEEEKNKKRSVALQLLSSRHVSEAVSRIKSHGIASMNDDWVRGQLYGKYPERGRDLPAYVTKGTCVTNLAGLRDKMLNLKRGSSPGTGGLRPEFLISLANHMEDDQMVLLQDFGKKYLDGDLPAWYYRVMESVMTVPAFKTKERNTLRPLGVKHQLVRVFHQEAIRQNRAELHSFLEPQQLALSEAGAGRM